MIYVKKTVFATVTANQISAQTARTEIFGRRGGHSSMHISTKHQLTR